MIVVDSGSKKLGKWVKHERNVFKDYIKVFAKKPPIVSGVAIMSDSDNTKESAVAYYGDIIFKNQHGRSKIVNHGNNAITIKANSLGFYIKKQ